MRHDHDAAPTGWTRPAVGACSSAATGAVSRVDRPRRHPGDGARRGAAHRASSAMPGRRRAADHGGVRVAPEYSRAKPPWHNSRRRVAGRGSVSAGSAPSVKCSGHPATAAGVADGGASRGKPPGWGARRTDGTATGVSQHAHATGGTARGGVETPRRRTPRPAGMTPTPEQHRHPLAEEAPDSRPGRRHQAILTRRGQSPESEASLG